MRADERDAGSARAPDGDRQRAEGDQPHDLRPGGRARGADRHRGAPVPRVARRDLQGGGRPVPGLRPVRRHAGADRAPGGPPAQAQPARRHHVGGRGHRAAGAGGGRADRPALRPARRTARRRLPHAAGGADPPRRRDDRRADARPRRGTRLRCQGDRARHLVCRPGGDRDGEHAPVQGDAGGAAAAEGVGGGAAGHQQLGRRHPAGVRQDPRQLQAPVRRRRARRAARRRAGPAADRGLRRQGTRHRRVDLPGAGGPDAGRHRDPRAARRALARRARRRARRTQGAAPHGARGRLPVARLRADGLERPRASAPSASPVRAGRSPTRSSRCSRPLPTRP